MELRLRAADPAGNVTLLVETPVSPGAYRAAAERLLAFSSLGGEQVGYLVPPRRGGDVRLEMMGGEFCGNALRCAALWAAERRGCGGEVAVEISGCGQVLRADVRPDGEVWAEMPRPQRMEAVSVAGHPATAVVFEGIVHVVAARAPLGEPETARLLPELAARFERPAAGLMFLEGDRMRPAVYVCGTDTLYWERSCASGSTAAACCEAADKPDGVRRLTLRQPGGVIRTETVVRGGQAAAVRLGGPVSLGDAVTVTL